MKFLFAFFLFVTTVAYSQEVFFCESYTENGSPVGPTNKLEIKPWGTAIYFLLDNNKKPLNDKELFIFVDKKNEDKFVPYGSKTLDINKNDTWAVTNYEFKEPGIYNVYFLNSKQQKIAGEKLKVIFAQGYVTGNNPQAPTYEGDCEMLFCEMVIDDKPINQFTSISLSRTGGRGIIFLNNSTPFNTDTLVLKVWKKNIGDTDYNEFIETRKYRILPEWSTAFIKYKFTQGGEFKFGVYTKDNGFISSSTVVVTN